MTISPTSAILSLQIHPQLAWHPGQATLVRHSIFWKPILLCRKKSNVLNVTPCCPFVSLINPSCGLLVTIGYYSFHHRRREWLRSTVQAHVYLSVCDNSYFAGCRKICSRLCETRRHRLFHNFVSGLVHSQSDLSDSTTVGRSGKTSASLRL
jgi:hypothetical protein